VIALKPLTTPQFSILAFLTLAFIVPKDAFSHGTIISPESRIYQCRIVENPTNPACAAAISVGLSFSILNIDTDADEFSIHSDDNHWLARVVEGADTLYSSLDSGEQTDSVRFQQGDFINFSPDTPHEWKNDKNPSQILFARKSA